MPSPPLSLLALPLSSSAGQSVASPDLVAVDVELGLVLVLLGGVVVPVLELVDVGPGVGLAVGGIGLVVGATVGSSFFVLLPSSVS